jgi:hypothetical protein
MNISEIEQVVENSINAPRNFSSTPIPIDELAAKLLVQFKSKRISPDPRKILSGFDQARLANPSSQLVYFLTDCDPESVFFDPETSSFGVAWGPEAATGRYFDDGTRDTDVLLMEFICEKPDN